MQAQYLEVGKIINTHGIRGEMKLQLWCDDISFLKQLKVLYLDKEGTSQLGLLSVRPQKNDALIRLAGIETIEDAEKLKNKVLYLHRDQVTLPEGKHFIQDLIGCKVVDIDNRNVYGTVKDVINLGASDIYVLRTEQGGEAMLPAVPDIVKQIDVAEGVISIQKMKGLFEDAD